MLKNDKISRNTFVAHSMTDIDTETIVVRYGIATQFAFVENGHDKDVVKIVTYRDSFCVVIFEKLDLYESLSMCFGHRIVVLRNISNTLYSEALQLQRRVHVPCAGKISGRDFVNSSWLYRRDLVSLQNESFKQFTDISKLFANCENGSLKSIGNCETGTYFDGNKCVDDRTLQCVGNSLNGHKRANWFAFHDADAKNARYFYKCDESGNNVAAKRHCRPGMMYDGLRCTPHSVHDKCVGRGDDSLVSGRNNFSYHRCRNGVSGPNRYCPTGKSLFNEKLGGKCVSPLWMQASTFYSKNNNSLSLSNFLLSSNTVRDDESSSEGRNAVTVSFTATGDGSILFQNSDAHFHMNTTAGQEFQWYSSYLRFCSNQSFVTTAFEPLHWYPLRAKWMPDSFPDAIFLNNNRICLVRCGLRKEACIQLTVSFAVMVVESSNITGDKRNDIPARVKIYESDFYGPEKTGTCLKARLFAPEKCWHEAAAEILGDTLDAWPFMPLRCLDIYVPASLYMPRNTYGSIMLKVNTFIDSNDGRDLISQDSQSVLFENDADAVDIINEYLNSLKQDNDDDDRLPLRHFCVKRSESESSHNYPEEAQFSFKADPNLHSAFAAEANFMLLTRKPTEKLYSFVSVGSPLHEMSLHVSVIGARCRNRHWIVYFPVIRKSTDDGEEVGEENLFLTTAGLTVYYFFPISSLPKDVITIRSTYGAKKSEEQTLATYALISAEQQFISCLSMADELHYNENKSMKRARFSVASNSKNYQPRTLIDHVPVEHSHSFLNKQVKDFRCRNSFRFNNVQFASIHSDYQAFDCDSDGSVLQPIYGDPYADQKPLPFGRIDFVSQDSSIYGFRERFDSAYLYTATGERVKHLHRGVLPFSFRTLHTIPSNVWFELPHMPLSVIAVVNDRGTNERVMYFRLSPLSSSFSAEQRLSEISKSMSTARTENEDHRRAHYSYWDYEKDECISSSRKLDEDDDDDTISLRKTNMRHSSLSLTEDIAHVLFV